LTCGVPQAKKMYEFKLFSFLKKTNPKRSKTKPPVL